MFLFSAIWPKNEDVFLVREGNPTTLTTRSKTLQERTDSRFISLSCGLFGQSGQLLCMNTSNTKILRTFTNEHFADKYFLFSR